MLEDETGQPSCHPEHKSMHNWVKWTMVHEKITELLQFQKRPYSSITADVGAALFLKLRWQCHQHIDEASSRAADKALLVRSSQINNSDGGRASTPR